MIYDNTPPLAFHYSVCRTWLLFKLFGHTHVSILHGGLAAWIEAGQSVTDKIPEFIKSEYEATLNEKLSRSYEDIVRNSKSQNAEFQLIDARGSSGFNAGSVPGSKNIPFSNFYNDDGSFKDFEQIEVSSKDMIRFLFFIFSLVSFLWYRLVSRRNCFNLLPVLQVLLYRGISSNSLRVFLEDFWLSLFCWVFFNSREAIAAIIEDIVYFTIQEFDCIRALSFFIFVRCFHTFFHDFELRNGISFQAQNVAIFRVFSSVFVGPVLN